MRKIVLVVIGFGVLAAFGAGAALAKGGGDVASAPLLPVGKQVSGGGKIKGSQASGSCSGYGEFWRLAAAKGDRVNLAYGTANGLPVKIVVMDPSVNDRNFNVTPAVAANLTYDSDSLAFVAKKSGRYTVVLYTSYPCQPKLAYTLTATLKPPKKK